jgi:flavin-binding protein dodecin
MKMKFDKKKLEEIKKLDLTKPADKNTALRLLKTDILNLLENGYKKEKIREMLKEIGIVYASKQSFNNAINKYILQQSTTTKSKQGEKMKPKVIAIVNFKGGVGKSTIANVLDLEDKVIINLDVAQDGKKINTDETYNFAELKELGIDSIEEAIEGAIEGGKKNIILDTPGEIGEFIEALPLIDYFIVRLIRQTELLKQR